MDNLESQTYETFEKDPIKYSNYEEAIRLALIDKCNENEQCIVMVVGAGRGPLVRCVLRASEKSKRKVKIYAVEKNPNAIITLLNYKHTEWFDQVEIISHDMRTWCAPQLCDILVSELLGSFGDNELSPECLDGAMRFLKSDGISIPTNSISYIVPISSSKLWSEVRSYDSLKAMETSYVVKVHNAFQMSTTKPLFTFVHPNRINQPDQSENQKKIEQNFQPICLDSSHDLLFPLPFSSLNLENSRSATVDFHIPLAATCTGFVGYFDSCLYKHVHISILPETFSTGMFSWFPIYFPIRVKQIYMHTHIHTQNSDGS
jgi:protein arginine N-methyltransferase 5